MPPLNGKRRSSLPGLAWAGAEEGRWSNVSLHSGECREGGGYIPPSSPGSGLGWDRGRRVVKLAGVMEVRSFQQTSLLSRVWPRLGPRKGGGKPHPPLNPCVAKSMFKGPRLSSRTLVDKECLQRISVTCHCVLLPPWCLMQ